MKIPFLTQRRQGRSRLALPQPFPEPPLTRIFVETGDPRCPVAGIWLRLTENGALGDDPESTRPVMWTLLSWRAFSPSPHLASLQYIL
jgi:hypothetical protein